MLTALPAIIANPPLAQRPYVKQVNWTPEQRAQHKKALRTSWVARNQVKIKQWRLQAVQRAQAKRRSTTLAKLLEYVLVQPEFPEGLRQELEKLKQQAPTEAEKSLLTTTPSNKSL
jgi:hypothetical protein